MIPRKTLPQILDLFADDAIVYHQIHSVEDQVILQNDLVKLAEWEQVWGHGISPTKLQLPQNLQIQKTKTIQIHFKKCHPSRGNFNKIPWHQHPIRHGIITLTAYITIVRSNLESCVLSMESSSEKVRVENRNGQTQSCPFHTQQISQHQ